jgi:hypothetical protein
MFPDSPSLDGRGTIDRTSDAPSGSVGGVQPGALGDDRTKHRDDRFPVGSFHGASRFTLVARDRVVEAKGSDGGRPGSDIRKRLPEVMRRSRSWSEPRPEYAATPEPRPKVLASSLRTDRVGLRGL